MHHPEAAAAARERLAAIPDPQPITHPDAIPAAPTASLVTDKATLSHRQDLAPTTARRKLPSAFAPLLTAIGIFALVLMVFKSPIIVSQIRYAFGQGSSQTTGTGTTASSSSVIPAENTISIPKINIHAPVEYIDSVQEADVQKALEDGVVHYGTTAVPGAAGNVAMFGHSSNDWWEPGNYKFVFVLLDKLSPGDQIFLDYQSVRYTYEVTGSKVVEPTAVDVLNPTATPTLTLITCSPPGTSLKRLVVTAKQTSPAPKTSEVAVTSGTSTDQPTLPSSAPGFFEQVGNFFTGVWQGISSLFGGSSSSQPSSSPGASPGSTLPVIK
jgi:LPXTG-site transpeptidase (sortase) family protein